MKRILCIATLLFSLMICHAQWDKRATVEISAGSSHPFGEFGYAVYTYDKSGFAENGIRLTGSFTYRVSGHLGLVASVSEHFLRVDEFNIANKYWIPEYGWNWTVESAAWLISAYMGGIDIILPVYKSDFQFRLLGGLASTRLPELTGSAYNFRREAETNLVGAWSVGTGFNYQYFDRITLSLMLDFFVTYPVLDDVWTSDYGSGSARINQNILLANISVGLGFRIF